MSLADTLERVGIVLGSMLLFALPASLVLYAVTGSINPWWGPLVLLGPGFVAGWAVAAGQTRFDYDDVWFVCFFGYVLSYAGLLAFDLQPLVDNTAAALAVMAAAFGVAGVVDYYWR